MGRPATWGAALLALATLLTATPAGHAGTVAAHNYVDDTLLLPVTSTEAAKYARNLDGEPGRDNALSFLFQALEQQNLDLVGLEQQAISAGSLVVINTLTTASLANTKSATWRVRYGLSTETPDFGGHGTFAIDPLAPRSARIPAKIKDHHVSTSAANVPLRLDLGTGPVTFSTVGTRIFATCSKSACTGGRINGAIPETTAHNILIPALVALLQPLIDRDCPGPGADSCSSQSTGETIVAIFDTDQDLTLTAQELSDNDLIQVLLAPDVDMFRHNGNPGHDGVADSLSFGIGFTAVRAKLG